MLLSLIELANMLNFRFIMDNLIYLIGILTVLNSPWVGKIQSDIQASQLFDTMQSGSNTLKSAVNVRQ